MGAELAALWKAVSKLAATLMWRTGQKVDVPVPRVVEEEAVGEVGLSGTPRDVATGEADLKGEKLEIVANGDTDLKGQKSEVVAVGDTDLKRQKSEVVASGMSERHRLVTLGVCFRRWTWTNTSTTMASMRRKFGCRGGSLGWSVCVTDAPARVVSLRHGASLPASFTT